jgi:hypothetical protein
MKIRPTDLEAKTRGYQLDSDHEISLLYLRLSSSVDNHMCMECPKRRNACKIVSDRLGFPWRISPFSLCKHHSLWKHGEDSTRPRPELTYFEIDAYVRKDATSAQSDWTT